MKNKDSGDLQIPRDDELKKEAKEAILSPEDIAERRFNNFINTDYYKTRISELRRDILALQTPGEIFVDSSTHKAQLREPLSPDERRGGDTYEGTITTYYLTVGARKKEQSDWSGEYKGGKRLTIASGVGDIEAPKETAEQIRDKLLPEKQQQLEDMFEEAKIKNSPSRDIEASAPESKDHVRRYETHWDKMQKTLEDQWKAEDVQLLDEAKQSWEQYEGVANDLLSARQEVEQAERLARVSHITLAYNARPSWGNIGKDTIEQMQTRAADLRSYASKLNAYIPNEIRLREQEFKTEEAVSEEGERQKEADIKEFGVSGTLLDTARSLTEEAKQKLGLEGARKLFKDTCNASYGRAGRQKDIKNQLGESISDKGRSFYSFPRARDVNAVLFAALKILEETHSPNKVEHTESEDLPVAPITAGQSPVQEVKQEIKAEELPHLGNPDKKGWWIHELPNGSKHSNKLNKTDRTAYDSGERIDVRCPSCPDNPLVGYLKK